MSWMHIWCVRGDDVFGDRSVAEVMKDQTMSILATNLIKGSVVICRIGKGWLQAGVVLGGLAAIEAQVRLCQLLPSQIVVCEARHKLHIHGARSQSQAFFMMCVINLLRSIFEGLACQSARRKDTKHRTVATHNFGVECLGYICKRAVDPPLV